MVLQLSLIKSYLLSNKASVWKMTAFAYRLMFIWLTRMTEERIWRLTWMTDQNISCFFQKKAFWLRACTNALVCLFVLRFYGPVNPMGSCWVRSVYLPTHLLGRLSPLSATNWQLPFLNQQKGKNDHRKYFMINLHERMLPTSVGVELATS